MRPVEWPMTPHREDLDGMVIETAMEHDVGTDILHADGTISTGVNPCQRWIEAVVEFHTGTAWLKIRVRGTDPVKTLEMIRDRVVALLENGEAK